jgi:hypothetical protein
MLSSISKIIRDIYNEPYRIVHLHNNNRVYKTLYFDIDEEIETDKFKFVKPDEDKKQIFIIKNKQVSFYNTKKVHAAIIANDEEMNKIKKKMEEEKALIEKILITIKLKKDTVREVIVKQELENKEKIDALRIEPDSLLIPDLSPKELKVLQQLGSYTKITKPQKKDEILAGMGNWWIYIVVGLGAVVVFYMFATGKLSIPI